MKFTICAFLMICSSFLLSQRSVDLRLVNHPAADSTECYNVQMAFSGDEAILGSQNYRIYYNSAVFKFLDSKSKMYLPEEFYSYRVVQHNNGVNAKGIGKLSFEENLGFINATIILNDARSRAFQLAETGEWGSILSLCFERTKEDKPGEVVLARKNLTGDYGRAFIELSYIDESGAISTLPIKEYQDISQ